MIQVAVLGYGTVGSGVVEVLETNNDVISERVGEQVNVKYVLDLREFPGTSIEKKVVHDFEVIVNDPEVSVICETMGGTEPAYTFSKKALLAGKSVCTSNKELVANHGPELIRLAAENNCSYLFEASVGGGIPIIRPLNASLTGDKVEEITGILNGTTNYILTKMGTEGADFESVLKQAQEKGYAEKNPEADVEGYDACRKIAILSSLMTGKTVHFEDIYTEGITKITALDFKYAKKLGCTIKLLATSKKTSDGVCAMISPCMVPAKHPLYGVSGVFNAIFVSSDMLGDSMYYGKGAGKLPTASAVVGDIIDCARNIGKTVPVNWNDGEVKLTDYRLMNRRFFVRVDKEKCEEAKVKETFKNAEFISLPEATGEYGFVTAGMTEETFAEQIAKLDGVITRIRLANERKEEE